MLVLGIMADCRMKRKVRGCLGLLVLVAKYGLAGHLQNTLALNIASEACPIPRTKTFGGKDKANLFC